MAHENLRTGNAAALFQTIDEMNKKGASIERKFQSDDDETSPKLNLTSEPNYAMDVEEIKEYLPQRYPFLLVDRILEMDLGNR